MYGDHHYGQRDSRPLSFVSSPPIPTSQGKSQSSRVEHTRSPPRSGNIAQASTQQETGPQANGKRPIVSGRGFSFETENGKRSPNGSPRERSNSDTANSAFPLNNVDYESSPAAVAQELSNLQALRRMSMDVNAAGDPDLPSFSSSFGIPSAAPTGASDEDDKARMFWVPARLHPELAPTEFQTFLNNKVESIKRRSGDFSLSPDSIQRQGSGGGLRRKKSMLSRQIDNSGGRGADGYRDGAEVLERKKSLSGAETLNTGISNLSDLEMLVNDSETVMQRLSIDTGQNVTNEEVLPGEDIPILPSAPSGNSLRRSTRTTYRRGSLKKGERLPYSKRAARAAETDGEESATPSPVTGIGEAPLARVQTEPLPPTPRVVENFSRPGKPSKHGPLHPQSAHPTSQGQASTFQSRPESRHPVGTNLPPKHFVSQIASNGRSSISPQLFNVPQIVETPPQHDEPKAAPKQNHLPERVSSHEPPPSVPPQGHVPIGPLTARRQKPPMLPPPAQNERANQTLKDMASHPSPLPGNSTRTDSLSFIPTFTEEKKGDTKKAKEAKEKESLDGSRKSSWSWGALLGTEEKEKEKRRAEEAKKPKAKITKPPDKAHDNTRLDLLQTTMEGSRGRESLVLDRGDLKLEEERKKESSRKTSGGEKREKDAGLFSSIFGGGKKKGEKEAVHKKHFSRGLSPEPPPKILKPDIDYMWTRFPILEERAIYRMAHIKLANPRRALHSQVLLSNFMYSYLAKVQQMHPQIQVPPHKQQAAQKKADQPEEFHQYQRYQEVCWTGQVLYPRLTWSSNKPSSRTKRKHRRLRNDQVQHNHRNRSLIQTMRRTCPKRLCLNEVNLMAGSGRSLVQVSIVRLSTSAMATLITGLVAIIAEITLRKHHHTHFSNRNLTSQDEQRTMKCGEERTQISSDLYCIGWSQGQGTFTDHTSTGWFHAQARGQVVLLRSGLHRKRICPKLRVYTITRTFSFLLDRVKTRWIVKHSDRRGEFGNVHLTRYVKLAEEVNQGQLRFSLVLLKNA